MDPWREFQGPNAAYVLALYDQYCLDPASVDADSRAFFDKNPPPPELLVGVSSQSPGAAARDEQGQIITGIDPFKVAAVLKLAQAIRWYGHWAAALDPLGSPPPGDPSLQLDTYGLNEADLKAIPAALVGGRAAEGADESDLDRLLLGRSRARCEQQSGARDQ